MRGILPPESALTPDARVGLVRLLDEPARTDRLAVHLLEAIDLGGGSSLRITLGRQWVDNATAAIQRGSPIGARHARRARMQSFEAVAALADGPRTWVFGARAEAGSFEQTSTETESLSTGVVSRPATEVAPRALGSAALYGQLQWKLGPTLTVLPGVRAEAHLRSGQAIAPRLAASFRPVEALQLRASVGRGFRAPTAKELGFVFDHSSYGYRVLGKEDLSPETSWGVNADVTYRPSAEATLRAGAFMSWVDDLIDVDVERGVSSGTTVDYRYENLGEARTFGVQVSASARLGERLSGQVAYDYLWTRNDVIDAPLGGRPPHVVTGSLRALLPWEVEACLRAQLASDAFVDADTRSPAHETVDLRIAREVWPGSQAYVGVKNLFDSHQEPGVVGDLRPPLGRVVYAGLRADWPWEASEEEE